MFIIHKHVENWYFIAGVYDDNTWLEKEFEPIAPNVSAIRTGLKFPFYVVETHETYGNQFMFFKDAEAVQMYAKRFEVFEPKHMDQGDDTIFNLYKIENNIPFTEDDQMGKINHRHIGKSQLNSIEEIISNM